MGDSPSEVVRAQAGRLAVLLAAAATLGGILIALGALDSRVLGPIFAAVAIGLATGLLLHHYLAIRFSHYASHESRVTDNMRREMYEGMIRDIERMLADDDLRRRDRLTVLRVLLLFRARRRMLEERAKRWEQHERSPDAHDSESP